MDAYLTEKLSGEIERYQSKDFLKAAMAVYVLTAYADGHMGLLERSRIDRTLMTEPGLKEFDFRKATEILEGYAAALVQEGSSAERILRNKVARMAGNHQGGAHGGQPQSGADADAPQLPHHHGRPPHRRWRGAGIPPPVRAPRPRAGPGLGGAGADGRLSIGAPAPTPQSFFA